MAGGEYTSKVVETRFFARTIMECLNDHAHPPPRDKLRHLETFVARKCKNSGKIGQVCTVKKDSAAHTVGHVSTASQVEYDRPEIP